MRGEGCWVEGAVSSFDPRGTVPGLTSTVKEVICVWSEGKQVENVTWLVLYNNSQSIEHGEITVKNGLELPLNGANDGRELFFFQLLLLLFSGTTTNSVQNVVLTITCAVVG